MPKTFHRLFGIDLYDSRRRHQPDGKEPLPRPHTLGPMPVYTLDRRRGPEPTPMDAGAAVRKVIRVPPRPVGGAPPGQIAASPPAGPAAVPDEPSLTLDDIAVMLEESLGTLARVAKAADLLRYTLAGAPAEARSTPSDPPAPTALVPRLTHLAETVRRRNEDTRAILEEIREVI